MKLKERKIDFWEAEPRYAELKRQSAPGIINDKELDAQRQQLVVQGAEGCWRAKAREANEWYYRHESGWIRGMPPGCQLPPTDEASDRRSSSSSPCRFPQGTRYGMSARPYRNPSRTNGRHRKGPPHIAPTRDPNGGWRRPTRPRCRR